MVWRLLIALVYKSNKGCGVPHPVFFITVILTAVTLCTCASSAERNPAPAAGGTTGGSFNFLTLPKSGELVILGVTGRQSSLDAEINMAREDAARKASIYHGVWASVKIIQSIGSGYFDYFIGSETKVDYDQQLEWYIEKMDFDPKRDFYRNDDGAVFVRFSYPALFPGIIDYGFKRNQDGSPEWVTQPPFEIGGLKTGVGHSGRQERLGDTIRKSYEAAVAAIVTYYFSFVVTMDTAIDGQNGSQIYSQSAGRLANFTILDMWMDAKSGAVYTLAVARQAD